MGQIANDSSTWIGRNLARSIAVAELRTSSYPPSIFLASQVPSALARRAKLTMTFRRQNPESMQVRSHAMPQSGSLQLCSYVVAFHCDFLRQAQAHFAAFNAGTDPCRTRIGAPFWPAILAEAVKKFNL